ncbi:hypothetical protein METBISCDRAFT_19803 [Metschnikowia bicuspidata]|uniref:HMA domain-containing protein n=1 Tax=Metschnikowia bicuspidata TaxID=27322 RepID=A0A4P9Z8G2_9ASCO|nr:hypothetical protein METBISCDRAFT_19803 [Metschnikowia bicuspidata]
MLHQYQFNVKMSCSGCLNAVRMALGRVEGVSATDIDLATQTVNVTATTDYDTVCTAIAKTGKKINEGRVVS